MLLIEGLHERTIRLVYLKLECSEKKEKKCIVVSVTHEKIAIIPPLKKQIKN
jgi:hypothetical protein